MASKTKHGLPETKGFFKVRGLVTGTQRENFFKPITTKSKKKMNIVNFGVETAPESTVYVTAKGMERDEVYFSKKSEVKGQKSEVKKVGWDKRFDDQGEGFGIIGITVGLKQDENGKNIVDTFADYDATEQIVADITDEKPVFVRGNIEYSSFENNDGELQRSKKFAVKQIYGSKSINFESEDFKEISDFKQKIIFVGIEKINDKDDPRFEVQAKIVTRDSVENTDFIVRDTSLANTFRSKLKPFTAIDVWGNILNKVDSDIIKEKGTASWGEEDSFKKIDKNHIRELVIKGADPSSIDTETYTEEKITEALKALNEFGSTGGSWGKQDIQINDDDLPW